MSCRQMGFVMLAFVFMAWPLFFKASPAFAAGLDMISTGTGSPETGATAEALEKVKRYFSMMEYKKAIDVSKEILQKDPDNLLALKRLGAIFYLIEMDKAAIRTWERALKLDPENENLKKYVNDLRKRVNEDGR